MSHKRGSPRRVDANHAEIVEALRAVGCAVLDLSAIGGGCPDLMVADLRGLNRLIEIKNPAARGKLNQLQRDWHDSWRGEKPFIVTSVEEALAVVGVTAQSASKGKLFVA